MNPFLQYVSEKSADPLEIRIYSGADRKYELEDDERDNFNYEKGKSNMIIFLWDNKKNKLNVSERKGSFNGILNRGPSK